MAMTKFFVHAGGRWCEVDAGDGSVAGWRGKARFLFCRRGRLEAASPAAVLRGLRALRAGEPSDVKDGPRLSLRSKQYINPGWVHRGRLRACTHTDIHCCGHGHTHTCNNNADCTAHQTNKQPNQLQSTAHVKVDASTQVQNSQAQTVRAILSLTPTNKRKRQQHITQSPVKITKETRDTEQPKKKVRLSRKRSRSNSESAKIGPKSKKKWANSTPLKGTNRRNSPSESEGTRNRRSESSDSVDNGPKLRSRTSKRVVSSSDSSRPLKKPSAKRDSSSDRSPTRRNVQRSRTSKRVTSSDSSRPLNKPFAKRDSSSDSSRPVKNPSSKRDSSSDESLTQRNVQMSNWLAKPVRKPDKIRTGDTCKELIIDEADIEVLRSFLIKYAMDIDIEAFDRDDEYKRMVFYRINPLVSAERCPTADALATRTVNPDSSGPLKDFLSHLGLRSVTESTNQKSGYKTRSKIVKDVSTDDTDKENFKDAGNSRNFGPKVVNRSKNGRYRKTLRVSNKCERDGDSVTSRERPVKTLNVESKRNDSKSERDSATAAPREREREKKGPPAKPLHAESKRNDSRSERDGAIPAPPARERERDKDMKRPSAKPQHVELKRSRQYTTQEDLGIVAWVCEGSRASRVNGNRLWRELQARGGPCPRSRSRDQPPGPGDQPRSWHSLRNRYLRYILPALASLHLPAATVARLRAAAAQGTGLTKKRSATERRNSIFSKEQAVVRGAWSRRPRTPARSPSRSPLNSRSRSPLKSPSRSTSKSDSSSSSKFHSKSKLGPKSRSRFDTKSKSSSESSRSRSKSNLKNSNSSRKSRSRSRSESSSSRSSASSSTSSPSLQRNLARSLNRYGKFVAKRRTLRSSIRTSPAPSPVASPPVASPPVAPRVAPRRTPRYSELTRQFASRHRSESPEPQPPQAPLLRLRSRRKKLFNPRALPA